MKGKRQSDELLERNLEWLYSNLSGILTEKSFEAGECIMDWNYGHNSLHIITSGRAKVYSNNSDGTKSILQFVGRGDYIGELELLGLIEESREVIACTSMTCITISTLSHADMLLGNPQFLLYLSKYLADKLYNRSKNFVINTRFTLIERLSTLILQNSENGIFNEKINEISDYLGVSYRHVNFTLAKLVTSGAIIRTRDHIIITDESVLNQISKNINND